MDKIKFIVPGNPIAKGRPKFSKRGKFVKAYTPEKTANFENLVCLFYEEKARGFKFDETCMLKMTINAYFSIPTSTSKKKKESMNKKEIRPIKRPDVDNVAKSICDALNDIAFKDDSQIVTLVVSKYYSDQPRTEITIESIEGKL